MRNVHHISDVFQSLYAGRQIHMQALYHVARVETLMQLTKNLVIIQNPLTQTARQGTAEPKRKTKLYPEEANCPQGVCSLRVEPHHEL